MPNGIPLRTGARDRVRSELALAPGELLIVSVGNLYAVKGHAVLIDALRNVRDRAGWRLAIAGRGEEEPGFARRPRRRASAIACISSASATTSADILAAGDVFVMPSLSEGLPLALVEGMSFGLPVVVTGVGGVPEVVTDGVEGLIVPSLRSGRARGCARASCSRTLRFVSRGRRRAHASGSRLRALDDGGPVRAALSRRGARGALGYSRVGLSCRGNRVEENARLCLAAEAVVARHTLRAHAGAVFAVARV